MGLPFDLAAFFSAARRSFATYSRQLRRETLEQLVDAALRAVPHDPTRMTLNLQQGITNLQYLLSGLELLLCS